MVDEDTDLRALLATFDPHARDTLRRVLIRDQADRDEIAQELIRYRDANGQGRAHIIDMLTTNREARQNVVRLLAEIDATDSGN